MKKTLSLFTLLIIVTILKSCIDPFDITTISYENILIVEGRLTNEYKQHKIYLSNTVKIDTIGINPEKNAIVYIKSNTGEVFYFSEIEEGEYASNNSFIPESDKTYTLKIETSKGKNYSSTSQQLTALSDIEAINISVDENNVGIEDVFTVGCHNS